MWIVFALLAVLQHQALAQDCYRGTVVDAVSGEPVPGATVVTSDRMTGTYANRLGKFRICTKVPTTKVFVSAIGYKSDTVDIQTREMNMRVALEPRDVSKHAVVVVAPLDGREIVKRVCQNMQRRRQESTRLRYSLYSLAYREVGTKSIRRTAKESVTEVMLTTNQNETSFSILDRRDLGVVDTTEAPTVWDDEMDLSSISIVIRGVHYPYHLNLGDLESYDYQIVDRDTSAGGQTIIAFAPSPSRSPGFKGKIVLRESDSVFFSTEFDLVNGRNMPYVEEYHVVQTFNPEISRLWFPVRDELTYDVQLWLLTGVSKVRSRGRHLRTIVDVEFDPEESDAPTRRADSMNTVSIRSELSPVQVDSIVTSIPVRPRSGAPTSFEDGLPVPVFGTTVSILPILYRSQAEQMGYGAWLTTRIDSLKFRVAFGSSQDDELLYGAGLSLSTWLSTDQQLKFTGEYLSSPISVQRDHIADRTIIRSWLSTAYPAYYSFIHAERADLSVSYLNGAISIGSRSALEQYTTDRYPVEDIEGTWFVQDLDLGYSTYPTNTMESLSGIPVRFASRFRAGWETASPHNMYAVYASMQTSLPMVATGIGDIRLGVGLQASATSPQTSIPFLSSQVPRFTFQGNPRSLATLKANDRFAESMVGGRLTVDLDDIPWRVLDLPSVNGIQPQFSLVLQGLRMWDIQELSQAGQSTPVLSVVEAGFRVSSIPLLITSLFQADVECTWSIDHNSLLQQPFRITFAITTPFSRLD